MFSFYHLVNIDRNQLSGNDYKSILVAFDDENGIICNKRQEEIFFKIRQKGKKTLEIMDNSYEDMISYELKGILNDFEEFFGEIRDDEILDAIFSEFCVGK